MQKKNIERRSHKNSVPSCFAFEREKLNETKIFTETKNTFKTFPSFQAFLF